MQPQAPKRTDYSGLLIRLLLLLLAAMGVVGILLVAPAGAAAMM